MPIEQFLETWLLYCNFHQFSCFAGERVCWVPNFTILEVLPYTDSFFASVFHRIDEPLTTPFGGVESWEKMGNNDLWTVPENSSTHCKCWLLLKISNDVIYFFFLPLKVIKQNVGSSLSFYTMNMWHTAFSNWKETSNKWGYKSQENRACCSSFPIFVWNRKQ